MKVLLVYAHPESRSLNGALRDFIVSHLQERGHDVKVSDLYAMDWKPTIDVADFLDHDPAERLDVVAASKHAYASGTQAPDIEAEQQKLLWADTLLLQFPLWWFSMPAILKGWVERVYAYGFGYGVGEHSLQKWGERYGEGTFAGKRAMVITTTGGWDSHYSARGINGAIEDLLFPINHGMLFYSGFDVLPPFVIYRTGLMAPDRFDRARGELASRLDQLETTRSISFRRQNGGDYKVPALVLKEGIAEAKHGLRVHEE